jgi:hypothetical protein
VAVLPAEAARDSRRAARPAATTISSACSASSGESRSRCRCEFANVTRVVIVSRGGTASPKTPKQWHDNRNSKLGHPAGLQIIPSGDKEFGWLSQLDDAKLVWIAAELNQALAI